ncbi:MAG: DUF2306 domain-containing protein [Porphyrobacter sp.]|nr:DUF2306 domain-containing protein [Porphyrobacter sp.]
MLLELETFPLPRRFAVMARVLTILAATLGACALAVVAVLIFRRDALPFYVLSEQTYGRFWPHLPVMAAHILGGSAALFLGPLQFWERLRRTRPGLHRAVGYGYLCGVALGAASAFYMSFHLELTRTVGFAVGLFCLAVCWTGTAMLSWWAIRGRNVALHRQLMAQNYALTLSFVVTRWLFDAPIAFVQDMGPMRYITMGWVGWVMPFALTGFYMQLRGARRL